MFLRLVFKAANEHTVMEAVNPLPLPLVRVLRAPALEILDHQHLRPTGERKLHRLSGKVPCSVRAQPSNPAVQRPTEAALQSLFRSAHAQILTEGDRFGELITLVVVPAARQELAGHHRPTTTNHSTGCRRVDADIDCADALDVRILEVFHGADGHRHRLATSACG